MGKYCLFYTSIKLAKQMEELGCQTICIKDMAGILGPKEAYDMAQTADGCCAMGDRAS